MSRVFAAAIVTLVVFGPTAPQRPTGRGASESVSVDVSVTDGAQPTEGLVPSDFDLRDNSVLQHVDAAPQRTDALDVSIILDVSGSLTGPLEDHLVEGARAIQRGLHSDDKAETIAVDREIRRTPNLADWMTEAPSRIGDGGTRLFDAILTAALERAVPGRRQVVVALTDGLDTGGVIDRATRLAVLGRSNVVVDLVAISIGGRRSGTMVPTRRGEKIEPEEEGDYDYLLREITDATGGTFYDVRPAGPFGAALTDELDRLRWYYTLRYRPTGVTGPGWHTLAVRLTRSHHDLHARSGYFGR